VFYRGPLGRLLSLIFISDLEYGVNTHCSYSIGCHHCHDKLCVLMHGVACGIRASRQHIYRTLSCHSRHCREEDICGRQTIRRTTGVIVDWSKSVLRRRSTSLESTPTSLRHTNCVASKRRLKTTCMLFTAA